MTKAIPFTKASMRRAILAVESAGKFVIGVRPDGTLIVGDAPIDLSAFSPANDNVGRSKWEDTRT